MIQLCVGFSALILYGLVCWKLEVGPFAVIEFVFGAAISLVIIGVVLALISAVALMIGAGICNLVGVA